MQWHWCRLVSRRAADRMAGGQIGLGLPRRHAQMPASCLCGGGERVDAIHPEPTGYADFAARSEAAKSRGWPMQMRGSPFPEREMLKDMMAGLDPKELIELALLLVAVGALSGFLAGVFGIGGGAILVPVFYECFRLAGVPLEVRMPLCIGTSLAIIIPTSISSFRAHYKRGAVDMDILKLWWLPIVLGVVAGSVTARYAPERLFKIVFVIVAWSAAARLLLARDDWKLGDEVPTGPLMRVYGFFIGLLSTLMGVGGGLFANLLMTFYGRPIHQAVATSSALAVLISIPGALGYVYAGWPAAARFPDVTALQMPFAIGYVSLIGAAACHADQPSDRAARRARRACDVEAQPGDGVRRVSVHCRQPVCDQPVVAGIGQSSRGVVPANAGTHNHSRQWLDERFEQRLSEHRAAAYGSLRSQGRQRATSRKSSRRYPAKCSSAPCPWRCAAVRRPRTRASAS